MSETVFIVGASSGIGLATAKAAAGRGDKVIMASRTEAKLLEVAKTVAGDVRTVTMDMLDRASVDGALTQVGSIDHLVLTAVANEYALFAPLARLTEEQVERSFDKFRGFVNVTRAAAPRKSITLLSGAGARKPPKETSLAAAANASVVSFGKALAVELAPVRVNVVMPGVVDTSIHGAGRDKLAAWAISDLPARRFGQPGDIADAILFLMGNPYMTGHTLVVDGGFLGT